MLGLLARDGQRDLRGALMDPNAMLDAMIEESTRILDDEADDYNPDDLGDLAVSLATRVQELDTWLSRSGYLPTAWKRNKGIL